MTISSEVGSEGVDVYTTLDIYRDTISDEEEASRENKVESPSLSRAAQLLSQQWSTPLESIE